MRTFTIKVKGVRAPVVVRADYHRLDDGGNVVFRNTVPNAYPEPVMLVARGEWTWIKVLENMPMPWCNNCKCYHHDTARCIKRKQAVRVTRGVS